MFYNIKIKPLNVNTDRIKVSLLYVLFKVACYFIEKRVF